MMSRKKATQALQIILSDRYEVIDSPPKFGKDFNDLLYEIRNLQIKAKEF